MKRSLRSTVNNNGCLPLSIPNPMLSNVIFHVGVYTARTTVVTKLFLRELQGKHDIDDAEFFVDGAPWLQAGLFELGMHFRHEIHGDRNPVKRDF